MNLLNQDNIVHEFLNNVGDIVIANILFIFCSIPLVTIGPSLTALYHCSLRSVKGDGQDLFPCVQREFCPVARDLAWNCGGRFYPDHQHPFPGDRDRADGAYAYDIIRRASGAPGDLRAVCVPCDRGIYQQYRGTDQECGDLRVHALPIYDTDRDHLGISDVYDLSGL